MPVTQSYLLIRMKREYTGEDCGQNDERKICGMSSPRTRNFENSYHDTELEENGARLIVVVN